MGQEETVGRTEMEPSRFGAAFDILFTKKHGDGGIC